MEKAREREQRMLENWKEKDIFKKSIENRKNQPSFVFYEGPPTANGMPHIGHVLGRVMKDFVSRYKTMKGFQVHRKAGWDTHGLPVELGVEKQLGISGKYEIEKYGVEKFINECKQSVFHYESEWRKLTEAIGYWVDMDQPYVTLEDSYIESVWYLLSEIHKKNLLYKGHRVSPYCPCCQTTLSSHEVAQGYEEVKDLSATAKFTNEQGEHFLAWTTTPWTLPSHVALALNKHLSYAKVSFQDETYIVAEDLVPSLFKGDYNILSVHKGSEFIGMNYTPPFSYLSLTNGNVVVHADFVRATNGTGIVHMAPAHGDDDYKTIKQHNLDFVLVVDAKGCYTETITDLAGKFVKDCDVDVIKMLAESNHLFSKEKYEHSYPFCWRCKSPLLYYATDSWFIKMTALREELQKNNQSIEWFPDHVKDGRFGNFLNEVVDWNISRNRYWGTPLNVWECSCGNTFVPQSKAELLKHSLQKMETVELHKPYVDKITMECSCGKKMNRVSEVIDVWFDSGSMPYAQHHYPFENHETFQQQFPADLVCEGIDQTRGWFYSLLAIGTLVYGKSPYKRVMALGHVLDEHGQKMSKSKGNVIDPWEIIEQYGTDAFRWSLLADSNPWSPKRFSKTNVQEAKSKVVDTLVNVYQFYEMYAKIDGFTPENYTQPASLPLLDQWLYSRLHTTLQDVHEGLEQYDFLKPAKAISSFIDELSNWYVRRSRDRFWASKMNDDKCSAYFTLHEALTALAKMMAPYTPFLSDDLYLKLGGEKESVHLEEFPVSNASMINLTLETEMKQVLDIVELSRSVRNNEKIKNKQPLQTLYVVNSTAFSSEELTRIIEDEMNVKQLVTSADQETFTTTSLKLNFKVAGPKLGKMLPKVKPLVENATPEQVNTFLSTGTLTVESFTLTQEDVLVEKQAKEGFASASNGDVTVVLDTVLTEELKNEGYVREVIREVQEYRKKLNLKVEQRVTLSFSGSNTLLHSIQQFENLVFENVLATSINYPSSSNGHTVTIEDETLTIDIKA